jgi:hypothetical protein
MAITFQVKRNYVGDEGAFGSMHKNRGAPFAVTLERTFKPNNDVIILPSHVYKCTKSRYYKGGYPTYEIHVDGHSRVLFHKGNKEAHSLGCILVAEFYHDFGGMNGIGNSAGGFNEFMKLTEGVDEFILEVT